MLKLIKAIVATIVLKLFMLALGALLVVGLRAFEFFSRKGYLNRKFQN